MRRLFGRRVAAVALVAGAGFALASCGGQSSLAKKACSEVDTSLRLFSRSQHATGAERTKLENQANVALRVALPDAAVAAGDNTAYQALEATLSESSRVPEVDLTTALQAQCAQINGS